MKGAETDRRGGTVSIGLASARVVKKMAGATKDAREEAHAGLVVRKAAVERGSEEAHAAPGRSGDQSLQFAGKLAFSRARTDGS